ncbi:S8 family peptidase [Pseudosporangium ferrugineum]|uniref:Serine protease AprX n=1 Tax=Pseudosporangium ferrugineum TaxID=439699 RepID=A0A2T0SFK7_9ACTN|nr:S8 family peptidase [Pseudosporangium ferrugineum]PRY32199.1 serine protease AprX [Pseudosporangium ferrugineum]
MRSNRRRGVALAAAAVVTLTAAPVAAAAQPAAAPLREVVVTGAGAEAAARAVENAGGRVLAHLPVAGGVAALLPQGTSLDPAWTVAPQRELTVADAGANPDGGATTVRQMVGLPARGNEGDGVTVAVVDTGIADVPDLAGRVTARVDLTGTGAGDGYGHGTFMAGLIAASGRASGGAYRGVAPAADLVDVKVADAEGRTDLITVLRGLQWVSDHRRGVEVLNLSLSSDSPLPYQVDPLNQALESLWRQGVTVVVPSGNDGPGTGSVTAPGNDPLLLTTGGLDVSGTAERGDDVVGAWSGRGPTRQGDAKPDLVAAGGHVISLRSPGSVVDRGNPGARVGDGYFRGSGTSMAAAVTSGAIAGAIAVQPRLGPDAVKNLLVSTAYASPGLTTAAGGGAGGLDVPRVLAAAPKWRTSKAQSRYDEDTAAVGRDAKRWAEFTQAVVAGDGRAAERAWDRLTPASRDWAARAWAQLDPAARAWAARAWAARAWAGADDSWTARAWAARAWAARAWASDDWAARAWADAEWSARAWAGEDWAARAWAAERWSASSWAWLPRS